MKNIVMFLMALAINCHLIAQNHITGVVTDGSDNSPIIGANVLIKGTTVGTITDINGKYSIVVPAGKSVLVFSNIGYKTLEETLKGRKVINVSLKEDTEMLDEVVVVGYGTMKKSDLSGSSVSMG